MNSEKNGIPDATPETVGRYVPRHNGVALVILLCVCVFFWGEEKCTENTMKWAENYSLERPRRDAEWKSSENQQNAVRSRFTPPVTEFEIFQCATPPPLPFSFWIGFLIGGPHESLKFSNKTMDKGVMDQIKLKKKEKETQENGQSDVVFSAADGSHTDWHLRMQMRSRRRMAIAPLPRGGINFGRPRLKDQRDQALCFCPTKRNQQN